MNEEVVVNPVERFAKLKTQERRLCQLLAIANEGVMPGDLAKLCREIEWPGRATMPQKAARIREALQSLVKPGVVLYGSYSEFAIAPAMSDAAIQSAIHDDVFDSISQYVQRRFPRKNQASYRRSNERAIRDLRIAFHQGDVSTYESLSECVSDRPSPTELVGLYDPSLFEQLPTVLRALYVADLVPKLIVSGQGDEQVLQAVERTLAEGREIGDELMAAAADCFFAAGRVDRLQALLARCGDRMPEIAGFVSILQGDIDAARAAFAETITGKKKGGGKSHLMVTSSMAGIFGALLGLAENSSKGRSIATAFVNSIASARHAPYEPLLRLLKAAIHFQESSLSLKEFCKELKRPADGPLSRLIGGYLWSWHVSPEDMPLALSGLGDACDDFARMRLSWFATEVAGLIGECPVKEREQLRERVQQLRGRQKTESLVNCLQPVAHWQKTLEALRGLINGSAGEEETEEVTASERMIWELTCNAAGVSLDVRPFIQKRSRDGWTKGRPVALEKLYYRHDGNQFAFLTDRDRAICDCMESVTQRNHYGYPETSYYFEEERLAEAIVGHPRLFHPGKREHPIEVVEQQPQLTVIRNEKDQIVISLAPRPAKDSRDGGFGIVKQDRFRFAVVRFRREHQRLNEILSGRLVVPSAGENLVMESIAPLASMIPVHSELEATLAAEQSVMADPSVHLHAVPYSEGLQLSFHVRPFGEEGPYFAPGVGTETVVAKVGDRTLATRRDLSREEAELATLIQDCPSMLAQLGGAHRGVGEETVYLPTADQALQALLELEPLVAANRLTLHWPRGRTMQLAGQASSSDFRMRIKRDRDWFAASGSLKVDRQLSVDMMQLIELVEASPSRFVRLDDGRFLALTEKFRRHIQAMSAYGDRQKGKLRFPPIRAAAMQDLEQAFQLTSDQDWKDCLRRIRSGQQRPVTIYRFITQGTVEERILELHASKRDLADQLLEGTDRAGKLTTEELLRLLRD